MGLPAYSQRCFRQSEVIDVMLVMLQNITLRHVTSCAAGVHVAPRHHYLMKPFESSSARGQPCIGVYIHVLGSSCVLCRHLMHL